MTGFRPREIGLALEAALRDMPVVVLTGLRQTGKSTLLRRMPGLEKRRYITFDDFAQLQAAREAPEALLRTKDPLTIDEAQRFPELLTSIKREVDRDRRPGRFLLCGSANFALLRDISESLAGRAAYLVLHPFTRRELSGDIAATPFLRRFFEDPTARRLGHEGAKLVSSGEVIRGGMPPVCLDEVRDAALWFRGYEQTYLERDVRDLSRVSDLVSFRNLLRLAALRSGQILKQSELARDAKLTAITTGRHLSLLEASFAIWRLPPFFGNRSTRLIKSPKLYVGDVGLACHLCGLQRLDAAADEPLRGAMFETWVANNLAAILAASWPDARLHFWNVQGRHEVDFVLKIGRDSVAVEVKVAERWDERDLTGLRAFLESTPRCRAGVLAYNGRESVQLGDRLWALPIGLVVS